MTEHKFGQFGPEHCETIKEGIRLYNQRKYWECHEELEHHWLEAMGDNARNVYWAVIQVAASLHHLRDGNMAGAQGMLQKALDKIEKCERQSVESELLYQWLSWQEFKRMVRNISLPAELKDFDELWDFQFIDPDQWSVK
jgi:hypothetical protein